MKTNTPTLFIAIVLIVAISCTKEKIVSPASATMQTSDNALVQTFHIGQSYGGGIIFYIDATGKHGLIAAKEDQGVAPYAPAGVDNFIGATGKRIGTGKCNTIKIINSLGRPGLYAALVCAKYEGGGYSDWFLPSVTELHELYLHRDIVGGFDSNSDYWSSTESDGFTAWLQFFGNIDQHRTYFKSAPTYVRAVRYF
jgi:hypothetical protein